MAVNAVDCESSYDAETMSLTVALPAMSSGDDIVITFPEGLTIARNPVEHDVFEICKDAQIAYPLKEDAFNLIRDKGVRGLQTLGTLDYESSDDHGRRRDQLPQSIVSAFEEVLLRS